MKLSLNWNNAADIKDYQKPYRKKQQRRQRENAFYKNKAAPTDQLVFAR